LSYIGKPKFHSTAPAAAAKRPAGFPKLRRRRKTVSDVKTLARSFAMLRYVVIFLVIALIAGLCGFTEVAGGAKEIARIVFYIFLVLFVISLIMGRRVP
jgi:uncharacterized membrane protein YtjA (UPF0391 family)